MKKIGAIIVMVSGLFSVAFGILGILAAKDILAMPDFLGDYQTQLSNITKDVKLTSTVIYGITIGFGLFELLLGYHSYVTPKGFISFIILVIFGAAIGFGVWNSIQADEWPIATIITISVSGVGFLSVLAGLLEDKTKTAVAA